MAAAKIGFRGKLFAMSLAIGIIPFVLGLAVSKYKAASAIETQTVQKLESLAAVKKQQIEAYLNQIRDQVIVLSENPMTVRAMTEFAKTFGNLGRDTDGADVAAAVVPSSLRGYYANQFGGKYAADVGRQADVNRLMPTQPAALEAQRLYIADNPNPLGEKDALDRANDTSGYSQAHGAFHPTFRSFLHKFGYYDIFLVEPEHGRIVYSVFKELDYATSLVDGPYRDTNLASVYQAAAHATRPDFVAIEDFAPYTPSYEAPASFIASPIFSGTKLIGVLVFQMPVDRINAVMQQSAGLGETGETVLLGSDGVMRSQSRLVEETTILNRKVGHPAQELLKRGQAQTASVAYGDDQSLVVVSPLDIQGLNWSIASSMSESEAFAAIAELNLYGVVLAIGVILAIIAVVHFFARRIFRQLGADPRRLGDIAAAIADGDYQSDFGNSADTSGVFASMLQMRAVLQERDDSEARAAEMARLKQALDNVTSGVMVADAEFNVIYLNESVKQRFQAAESDIRKELPHFNASQLLGTKLDLFHKDPAQQHSMLERLTSAYTSELVVGGHTLRMTANPVKDETGERIGTVVEWEDRTQEVSVEHEVQGLVEAAKSGDLTRRITLDGKSGYFEALGRGMNELVEVAERVIDDTLRVLGALSRGDLTEKVEAHYEGSFNQLKTDANATTEKLAQVMGEIRTSAESVGTGASELAQGNLNLSSRTEQQASSLEETAASMEEMTSTVKQNADNAQQANQLAISACKQAERGGAVVGHAVDAMSEISTASKQIADITGVIDEIAFQTNLLALNASVEAARAGEQGRGFAVVAAEVRNLAGRSATAAKEIKALIGDSVGKVEDGVRLVEKSGQTLQEIVIGVQKVTDIVAEIAAASSEQSSGIDQVNAAVMQMDEMTQQNAALVEEAAAASASIGSQASQLRELVGFFDSSAGVTAVVPEPGEPSVDEELIEEQPVIGAPKGVERRSSNRPWSGEDTPQQAPAAAASRDADDEWEEF